MINRDSVYLHFFDRELWESVGRSPESESIQKALKVLVLATNAKLYCSQSLLWENPILFSEGAYAVSLVQAFVTNGVIEPIGRYPTIGEYIESRRELYHHDQERYPLYFSSSDNLASFDLHARQIKKSSATDLLVRRMRSWAEGGVEQISGEKEPTHAVRRAVSQSLSSREEQAITFTFFKPFLESAGGSSERAEHDIRRQISRGYTAHYMKHANGDVATGIRSLSYFESLSETFPQYDVVLLEYILKRLGRDCFLTASLSDDVEIWKQLSLARHYSDNSNVSGINIREILVHIFYWYIWRHGGSSRSDDFFGFRNEAIIKLREVLKEGLFRNTSVEPSSYFQDLAIKSQVALNAVKADREIMMAYEKRPLANSGTRNHLLLVTATEVERDTVLRLAESITAREATIDFGNRRTYYRLGIIGNVNVSLVQCEMGASTLGGSLITVSDAIKDTAPLAVIMVGIAFGVDDEKQSIGEIIVSKNLLSYEMQRVGTNKKGRREIVARGDRVTASTKILSRLRAAESGWTGKKVHFGMMLSGEKLVDNIDYRDELMALEPSAKGGEMEGAGVYVAAQESNTDWMIVKAICDWADGNKRKKKKERQQKAAEQAVGFVLRAISQGGFEMLN
ncbi:hypothetical protein [Hwanghaeella sp. LZ110]|uniref:5'-methylthioadenosine/S-adenosylhomocysteine nucleosidase family protein n=1 Tax=Hwanghaeella sp. LZ110 TaxID=3402810 RepID=UPI003B685EE1